MEAEAAALKVETEGDVIDRSSILAVYSGHPFLAMVPKDENCAGQLIPVPVQRTTVKFIVSWDQYCDNVQWPAGGMTDAERMEVMVKASGSVANGLSAKLFHGGNDFLGLTQWIPPFAPAPYNTFAGVDRSLDVLKFAGVRYDGGAQSLVEALIDTAATIGRPQLEYPDVAFVGPGRLEELKTELGDQVKSVRYVADDIDPRISFEGVRLWVDKSDNRDLHVFEDSDCPVERGYVLSVNSWTLVSMKRAPHAMGSFGRVGYYAQLLCDAPFSNGTVRLRK